MASARRSAVLRSCLYQNQHHQLAVGIHDGVVEGGRDTKYCTKAKSFHSLLAAPSCFRSFPGHSIGGKSFRWYYHKTFLWAIGFLVMRHATTLTRDDCDSNRLGHPILALVASLANNRSPTIVVLFWWSKNWIGADPEREALLPK